MMVEAEASVALDTPAVGAHTCNTACRARDHAPPPYRPEWDEAMDLVARYGIPSDARASVSLDRDIDVHTCHAECPCGVGRLPWDEPTNEAQERANAAVRAHRRTQRP